MIALKNKFLFFLFLFIHFIFGSFSSLKNDFNDEDMKQ